MAGENDIPLAQVMSHASSTGARKPNQGTSTMDSSAQGGDEKQGLFHRSGGRRKLRTETMTRRETAGSDDISLNAMGRLYNKIIGFSVVTRYLVFIVPIAILLAAPLIVLPITGHKVDILVGSDGGEDRPTLFNLFLWIEVAWLTLWAGKLVAWSLPPVFMFFCGVVSSGTRKYATVLENLQIALSLFFWALASFITFKSLFSRADNAGISWVVTVARILGATMVSAAVYLVEKAIVQLIGISYHQRSFANRIRESKREVHLLGLLYDASRTLFPMYCPEFSDEDYIINDSIDLMLSSNSGSKTRGSVTPLRLIGNVGRMGDKVTAVFGNIASEITGKQVFNPNSAHSIIVEALEKVKPSEALARRIWMSFVVEGKDALYMEDVAEVLGPAYKDEAEEAFNAIDNDQNGDVSLDEMVRKVIEIGKERKAITEGMKDIGQALRVFDEVLMFIVLLIVIFIFLAWFQSGLLTTVATAGTALLSLSFIFAVTAQEFLGSCIFLFVKHPYDVGDRVDIVGPEKEQLIVDKISLLYTVFTRIDRMQVVQVPNIVLNNNWIENVSRSKAMKEVIDVSVSYDTSFEDLELLRIEMEKFVRSADNSRDFQPDIAIGVAGVGDLDKLQLKIAIKHKSNWHNEIVRATRRSKFMCALTLALKKVPIYNPGGGGEALGAPGNPSYSVAVSDELAARAREKAAKDKDAKRLVPSKVDSDESDPAKSGLNKVERQAAAELNTRDPGMAEEEWGYRVAEEQTLNSREQSADDRRRSNDIDRVRQDLLKRESTRSGRRKPGEGLPPLALGGNNGPGVQLTQASPRHRSFDPEAQISSPASYRGGFYSNNGNTTTSVTTGQGQPAYSVFPPPRNYSPPGSSGNNMPAMQGAPHPLQSQPIMPQQTRSRGQSVSRNQQGPPPPLR